MVHCSEAKRRLGNLIDFATIRFEGKHSYFKTVNKISHNYINIPKTIARKHQINLCYRLLQENLLNDEYEVFNSYECKLCNLI